MSFIKTDIFITLLPRTLFPRHSGDSVPRLRRDVDSFQVFKITCKDQN